MIIDIYFCRGYFWSDSCIQIQNPHNPLLRTAKTFFLYPIGKKECVYFVDKPAKYKKIYIMNLLIFKQVLCKTIPKGV